VTTEPEDSGSLRARAVAAVAWTALQKWSVRLSTFVSFLLLGRLLSPHDFGVVAVASVFITLMTTLADAGFATYLVQAKVLTAEAKNTAFYIATGSGALLFLLGVLLAAPLAAALDVPQLREVLPALSFPLVLVGLSSVPAALLTREMRFQALAIRQVLANVLSVIAGVALAFAGAGVWALVAQLVVLRIVTTLALAVATDFRPQWSFSRDEAGMMLSYSLKAMGAQLLQQARDQGEALLLGALAGPVALGLWTVAGRLVLVVGDLLGTVVGSVSAPMFARVQADPPRLTRAISGTAGLGTLLLAPALALLGLLSPQLVPQVFGEQWRSAGAVASLLAVRGVLLGLSALDRTVLLNAGRAGSELAVIAVLTSVHLVVVAAVAQRGLTVLAAVLLVEALLVAPVRPVLLHRWLGVSYHAYDGAIRVVVATALSAAAAYLPVYALGLTGGAVYGTVLGLGLLVYPAVLVLLARPVLQEAVDTLRLARARRSQSSRSSRSTTLMEARPSSHGQ
jgi:O-antigen/teichoic acid export membrane protein